MTDRPSEIAKKAVDRMFRHLLLPMMPKYKIGIMSGFIQSAIDEAIHREFADLQADRKDLHAVVKRKDNRIAELQEDSDDWDRIRDLQRAREKPYVKYWQRRTNHNKLTHPDYGEFMRFLIDENKQQRERIEELIDQLETNGDELFGKKNQIKMYKEIVERKDERIKTLQRAVNMLKFPRNINTLKGE